MSRFKQHSTAEESATGLKLCEWAKRMGYMPDGKVAPFEEYPDPAMFQMLCKGKGGHLWKQVIDKVHSLKELDVIRKNLLLKKVREGVPLRKPPVSGYFGQQLASYSQLQANLMDREKTLEQVKNLELAVKDKEKYLKKSVYKIREAVRQTKECETKMHLLKIKRGECEMDLQWLKHLTEVSNTLCPPAPHALPFNIKSKSTAVAILEKCLEAVKEFHDNTLQNCNVSREQQEQRKRALWEFLSKQVSGWGAQCLWDALTLHIMNQHLTKSANLATTASVKKVTEANGLSENVSSTLNARFYQTFLKAIHLEMQTKVKSLEFQKLKNQVIASIEAHFSAHNLNTTTLPSEEIRHWVDLHCQRERASARKKSLQAEIFRLHEDSAALYCLSDKLKENKKVVNDLDENIAFEKKRVEENLSHIGCAASKLEMARGRVMKSLDNFKQQHSNQGQSSCERMMSLCSDSGIPPSRKVPRIVLNSSVESLHESSCVRGNRITSSTMIGDETADQDVLSFDSTTIILDSTTSSKSEGKSLSTGSSLCESVASLQEAVSKEAKMFFKLPLETVPQICLPSGLEEQERSLLVLAPPLIPRVASTTSASQRRILHHIPVSSAPHVIFHELRGLNHARALLIKQIVSEPPQQTPLCAPLRLGDLLMRSAEQETTLSEYLSELSTIYDNTNSHLASCKETLNIWRDHPIQDLIPTNLIVNGATFKVWKEKLETVKNKF